MFKGQKLQKQVSQSYDSCILQIVSWWKTFAEIFKLNISNSFQVTEWTQIYYRNHYFQSPKGHNSKSRLTRVTVLVFCSLSDDALHLCEVSSKYLEQFCNLQTQIHSRNGYFQYLLCSKDPNSKSRLTRVTIFLFCTLSHGALHLWEVSSKYLEQFSTYRENTSSW